MIAQGNIENTVGESADTKVECIPERNYTYHHYSAFTEVGIWMIEMLERDGQSPYKEGYFYVVLLENKIKKTK